MPILDRAIFFKCVRSGPFPGKLTQRQVDGMNAILDAWEESRLSDLRFLAYILATAFHETGARMVPVREGFATSDAAARKAVNRLAERRGPESAVAKYAKPTGPWGHVYYGRGHVQLTWHENYVRMGNILDLPLSEHPDLALDPRISAKILIEGMTRGVSGRGDFTGEALSDFFNETKDDPVGARKIVNGADKAALIAGYYTAFLAALEEAQQLRLFDSDDEKPRTKPRITDETSWGAILAVLGGLAAPLNSVLERADIPVAIATILVIGGGLLILHGRLKLVRETGE